MPSWSQELGHAGKSHAIIFSRAELLTYEGTAALLPAAGLYVAPLPGSQGSQLQLFTISCVRRVSSQPYQLVSSSHESCPSYLKLRDGRQLMPTKAHVQKKM